MIDVEQAVAALDYEERGLVLVLLIEALHDCDTDGAYKVLRDWDLDPEANERLDEETP